MPEPGPRPDVRLEEHLERAREVGLHHALTVIADRQTALEFAAESLKRDLAGSSLTVGQFLKAIAALSRAERHRVRRAVPGLSSDQRVAELPAAARNALAATLRVIARRAT